MEKQGWLQRNKESFVTGLVVCTAWALIEWLAHKPYGWLRPFFYGGIAGAIVFLCSIAIILLRRWPVRYRVSDKNIEGLVREWLDNFKVAVKNDPWPEAYFRLRVTLDSGKVMTIGRYKTDYPDYVKIIADLGIRGENSKRFQESFDSKERMDIIADVHLELARAKMGYSGLTDPPENFIIIRRVPIIPTLTEFAFMSMVADVEAAMNLVFVMFLKAKQRKDASTTLPEASDNPMLPPKM